MPETLLEIRGLSKSFGALRATDSVDLEVSEGETLAIGFSPYPYRLAAFVIAGAMGGLAGALLVNHTNYLTPDFMHWTRSGEIMFMVILGGMATSAGPVLGAFAFLLVEDMLSSWLPVAFVRQHWQLFLGPLLVLSVLFFRRGLAGIFGRHDG